MTDLLIHDKISYNVYQEMVPDLHNYVLKIDALDHGNSNKINIIYILKIEKDKILKMIQMQMKFQII